MLSERNKRERQADRDNEVTIAEAYCKALGITDEPFQHLPLHPVDYSIFHNGEFLEFLEIRVRGKTVQQYEKEGWIPIGQPKLYSIEEHAAKFINLIVDEDLDTCVMYELLPCDPVNFDFYLDRRPYRRREVVYQVPMKYFTPIVVNGEKVTIPVDQIHFRRKGKDTTDFNKKGPRQASGEHRAVA